MFNWGRAHTDRRFAHGTLSIIAAFAVLLSVLGSAGTAFAAGPTVASSLPQPKTAWKTSQKCDWLNANFPQTSKGVKDLGVAIVNGQNPKTAPVSAEQIQPTKYGECQNGGFDGFILLGPQSGFDAVMRTLAVPPHGVIAGYLAPNSDPTKCGDPGPTWTATTVYPFATGSQDPCDDTYIAFDGSFTGLSMSFYVWNDFDAPSSSDHFDANYAKASSGSSGNGASAKASPASGGSADKADCSKASTTATSSTDLATKMGWTPTGLPVNGYGGDQVTINKQAALPACWEAQGSYTDSDGTQVDVAIKASDTKRDMKVGADGTGVYTIYPPCADRSALGVKGCGN